MEYNDQGNELVLSGGIVCGTSLMKTTTGSVWVFNLKSHKWTYYSDLNSTPAIGHQNYVHQNVMYSFFGLNAMSNNTMPFLSNVRRFDLSKL